MHAQGFHYWTVLAWLMQAPKSTCTALRHWYISWECAYFSLCTPPCGTQARPSLHSPSFAVKCQTESPGTVIKIVVVVGKNAWQISMAKGECMRTQYFYHKAMLHWCRGRFPELPVYLFKISLNLFCRVFSVTLAHCFSVVDCGPPEDTANSTVAYVTRVNVNFYQAKIEYRCEGSFYALRTGSFGKNDAHWCARRFENQSGTCF